MQGAWDEVASLGHGLAASPYVLSKSLKLQTVGSTVDLSILAPFVSSLFPFK